MRSGVQGSSRPGLSTSGTWSGIWIGRFYSHRSLEFDFASIDDESQEDAPLYQRALSAHKRRQPRAVVPVQFVEPSSTPGAATMVPPPGVTAPRTGRRVQFIPRGTTPLHFEMVPSADGRENIFVFTIPIKIIIDGIS